MMAPTPTMSEESPLPVMGPATIPPEILSEIFEFAYFSESHQHELSGKKIRALLSLVSAYWQGIVNCTPALWSIIPVSSHEPELSVFMTSLARSGAYPLDVRIPPLPGMTTVMNALVPNSYRWKRLSIRTYEAGTVLAGLNHSIAPLLEDLTIENMSWQSPGVDLSLLDLDGPENPFHASEYRFPVLKTVLLRSVDLSSFPIPLHRLRRINLCGRITLPDYSVLREALDGAPLLEELGIEGNPDTLLGDLGLRMGHVEQDLIVLPSLRSFRLTIHASLSISAVTFSSLFSLLVLEQFAVYHAAYSTWRSLQFVEFINSEPLTHSDNTPCHPGHGPSTTITLCNSALAIQLVRAASSTITTVTLNNAWSTYTGLNQFFNSLPNLQRLILDRMSSTGLEGQLPIIINIPSLQCLTLILYPHEDEKITLWFLATVNVPNLQELILHNPTSRQLKELSPRIYQSLSGLEGLQRLTIFDSIDPLEATCPLIHHFPNLLHLSLIRAHCNGLLASLANLSYAHTCTNVDDKPLWPSLRTLTILDNPHVSKPLLHRLVSARKESGHPLERFVTDDEVIRNPESVAWLKEQLCLDIRQGGDGEGQGGSCVQCCRRVPNWTWARTSPMFYIPSVPDCVCGGRA